MARHGAKIYGSRSWVLSSLPASTTVRVFRYKIVQSQYPTHKERFCITLANSDEQGRTRWRKAPRQTICHLHVFAAETGA